MNTKELNLFATQIRQLNLKTLAHFPGKGHIGGTMSIIDLLAVLYGNVMNVDPQNPHMDERDQLVMSKGHAGPALYATLALKGFFDPELLLTLNEGGTMLPSHCDRTKTPGIDMTTGSLGLGLSTAVGIALSKRVRKLPGYVYCIIGDGESQEGQIWEAAMLAPQFKVDNLIVFLDNNKQQVDGYTKDILDIEDIEAKFAALNWHTQRIDGHDVAAIENAIAEAKKHVGVPSAIVLETVKGKGCGFAMNRTDNHDMRIDEDMLSSGMHDLEAIYKQFVEE